MDRFGEQDTIVEAMRTSAESMARKLPFVPSVAPVSKSLEDMTKDELIKAIRNH